MDYAVVRRLKDGVTITIPAKDLNDTLKQGFTLVESVNNEAPAVQAVTGFPCPLCEFVAKSNAGLSKHKAKHARDN